MSLDEAKAVYTKWLELPDTNVLDFMFGAVFGCRFDGDPVWGGIIGASGDTKTELLRSIADHPEILSLSSLTENTLISGYIDESGAKSEDPSLLPKLHNKILLIKELTPLLTGNYGVRNAVLGQLRDAYDGMSSKAYGTGEVKRYESKFGVLMGVTHVVEESFDFISSVGERFLYYRTKPGDTIAKISAAVKNVSRASDMRDELSEAGQAVLNQAVNLDVNYDPQMEDCLIHLADFMARARSYVRREGRTEDFVSMPTPEVGTRLVGQFIRLGHGIAAAYGRPTWGDDVLPVLHHVAESGIPRIRLELIKSLAHADEPVRTQEIGINLGLPTGAVKKAAEDLVALGIVERFAPRSNQHSWCLKDSACESLVKSRLIS